MVALLYHLTSLGGTGVATDLFALERADEATLAPPRPGRPGDPGNSLCAGGDGDRRVDCVFGVDSFAFPDATQTADFAQLRLRGPAVVRQPYGQEWSWLFD